MATTNELLPGLKIEMSKVLFVHAPERYLAKEPVGNTYSSWERNWYQRPPAVVRVNGVTQTSGYSVNYRDGTVTFTAAPASTAAVTAEFYFSPFSDEELSQILYLATREFSSLIGEVIDPTADLSTLYEAPITDLAFKRTFEAMWAQTAEYHVWDIDGARTDKTGIAKAYASVVKQKYEAALAAVQRIRLVNLVGGTTATTTEI